LSGITAECVSALVRGTAAPVELEPFALERFRWRRRAAQPIPSQPAMKPQEFPE
jgi:hypothetical protein